MALLTLDRRTFLKASAASMVAAGSGARIARAAGITLGIVYVGPRDDFGWNQAHAVAAKALKTLPGVTVVEEENVPETDACAKAMESMVNLDGANIILGTSFGYFDPFMIDLSKKYAKVEFRHAAPLWTPALPMNLGSYFGYLNQAHYVDGVAAGLSTKSNKLGFVAAKPIASVLSNINSFMLGAKIDQPELDGSGHLYRRLVAAGARGRSGERAGRCRQRRHHLSRRQPQGRHRDRREARGQDLRPQCVAGAARSEGLYYRRRIQVGDHLQGLCRRPHSPANRCPTW